MATQTLFKNQPSTSTTGSSGTTTSDTAWTVTSSAAFPAASNASTPATVFHICDPANPVEIITVTNVSGTNWTVTRGAESSTAVAHAAGALYYQVTTAADMANMIQAAGVGQSINPGTLSISDGASAGAVFTVTNTTTTPTGATIQWFGKSAADSLLGIGITGDTVFRLTSDTNGSLSWGPGGSTAVDTTLSRTSTGNLTLNPGSLTIQSGLTITSGNINITSGSETITSGNLTISAGTVTITDGAAAGAVVVITNSTSTPSAPTVKVFGKSSADAALGIGITGDTVFRFNSDTNGQLTWGPGGGTATDTTLARSGAGILTLNPGALVVNGSITAGDGVLIDDIAAPPTPSLGPLLYGVSGQLKYIGTDGNAYMAGKLFLYNAIGNQSITSGSMTGLQSTNGASSQMSFPVLNGVVYHVEGQMFYTTANNEFIKLNFGNVAWAGNINMVTYTVNTTSTTNQINNITQASNGIFDSPGPTTTTENAAGYWVKFDGLITPSASGTILVQGSIGTGSTSWTFNVNSWFSFEPIM